MEFGLVAWPLEYVLICQAGVHVLFDDVMIISDRIYWNIFIMTQHDSDNTGDMMQQTFQLKTSGSDNHLEDVSLHAYEYFLFFVSPRYEDVFV